MPRYKIRELKESNINSDFYETLSNLSNLGIFTVADAKERLRYINKNPLHHIMVALDERESVIGMATILIEPKFIHCCGFVGHIEDVVVHKDYTKQHIGEALVKYLIKIAQKKHCYKVILDCNRRNIGFYKNIGFKQRSIQMRVDL